MEKQVFYFNILNAAVYEISDSYNVLLFLVTNLKDL